eukprot:GEMP01019274.1.p1 GENE.GEMP01019274.1~~GEMP01019274.1.p1  ORF type:complete len:402 (+),score=49.94 GEMP01019274.1:92-1297(+)
MGAILSAPVDSIIVERAGCAKLRCAVATMQGWRASHEDSHVMVEPPLNAPDMTPFFFSVMDGHGGDEAALEMHDLLPKYIDVATLPKITDLSIEEVIQSRFKAVDMVLRTRLPSTCSAGTTCTSALVVQSEKKGEWDIILANAGDSRSIVIHQDATFIATEDHKPDNPGEMERIKKAGGFVSKESFGPSRVDSNLAVSRAFGDFDYKDISANQEDHKISCVPDVIRTTAKDGDFVLLCCDGIFDVMSNEECVSFVLNHNTADLGLLCSKLLKLVLDKGSRDNCSAMICHLSSSENHIEDDAIQGSTTLDRAKWQGFHSGYMTSMLIPGIIPFDVQVQEKFDTFHRSFGFPAPIPEPCSNCENIYLGMQICSRCRRDQYCSLFCQRKDWRAKHKEVRNTEGP